eukprot:TRINITY_DN656_c0_g1_i1.p1 TRINITY_DN656_c0_g1~~TRINITY_DN656_c0_g1_i1.p1  ORF type:complete len:564 (-),score=166.64 TRINITY_DN656_c0_g1_i1:29-1639(-)
MSASPVLEGFLTDRFHIEAATQYLIGFFINLGSVIFFVLYLGWIYWRSSEQPHSGKSEPNNGVFARPIAVLLVRIGIVTCALPVLLGLGTLPICEDDHAFLCNSFLNPGNISNFIFIAFLLQFLISSYLNIGKRVVTRIPLNGTEQIFTSGVFRGALATQVGKNLTTGKITIVDPWFSEAYQIGPEWCVENFKRCKVDPANFDVSEGDPRRLPFAEDSFDVIILTFGSFIVFPEEWDQEIFIAEMHRILKPEGSLVSFQLEFNLKILSLSFYSFDGEQRRNIFIHSIFNLISFNLKQILVDGIPSSTPIKLIKMGFVEKNSKRIFGIPPMKLSFFEKNVNHRPVQSQNLILDPIVPMKPRKYGHVTPYIFLGLNIAIFGILTWLLIRFWKDLTVPKQIPIATLNTLNAGLLSPALQFFGFGVVQTFVDQLDKRATNDIDTLGKMFSHEVKFILGALFLSTLWNAIWWAPVVVVDMYVSHAINNDTLVQFLNFVMSMLIFLVLLFVGKGVAAMRKKEERRKKEKEMNDMGSHVRLLA